MKIGYIAIVADCLFVGKQSLIFTKVCKLMLLLLGGCLEVISF